MKASILRSIFALGLLIPSLSPAAVRLATNLPSLTVLPGDSFTISLNLIITADEEAAGVDYYWQIAAEAAGWFALADRDLHGSAFSLTYHDQADVLASPANQLDPFNAFDLGGLSDAEFLGAGTWNVADYTFAVSPEAKAGTYELSTFSRPGTGWVSLSPTIQDHPFDQPARLTILVVPEVSSHKLVLLGAVLAVSALIGRAWRTCRATRAARSILVR